MKKIKILGKSVPILVLVLLVAGLVSGALLTYYAQITGKAEVKQSVIVVGCTDNECEYNVGTSPAYAGSTYVKTVTVENRANQQVPIGFETTVKKCSDEG